VSDRWATGRIEAFSDGVLAIAVTLLVLEIDVPKRDFDNLWAGIAHQWPSYFAFVTSFLTIGAYWLAHHGVFRRLRFVDSRVMRLNLVLLMAITFLPFPTKLMAEAIHDNSAERAAVIAYGVNLFAISVVFSLIWEAVRRRPELLEPDVTAAEVARFRRRTAPGVGFYGAIVVLSVLAPRVAAIGFLAIAVWIIVVAPGDPRPSDARSAA
jgi:uncharacterized membrane protein